jgi:DNA-binding phage protein
MQVLEDTTPFDAAAYVTSDDMAHALLREALEHGDADDLTNALETIRRARPHLLAQSDEQGPTIASLMALVQQLGLRLKLEPFQA